MSEINLYKISDMSKLKSKLENKEFEKKSNTKEVIIGTGKNKEIYLMEFYYNHNIDLKELSWKNFALNFDFNPSDVQSNPRAMILIFKDNQYYAISFGTAYHYLESFSDKEWAFNFAKRIEYNKVNLMATTIPHSKRNKQISSYRNYNDTDVNVGEALSKITAYMEPNDEFPDVGDKIQAGNSLKLRLQKDNLETIAKVISYVEKVIATGEIYWDMPHMVEVKEEKKLNVLNNKLKKELLRWSSENRVSDLVDVNNFVIYSNDFKNLDDFTSFKLIYKKENSKAIEKKCTELTMTTILEFIASNNIGSDCILDIKILMTNENKPLSTNLSKIIVYDCVDENCIFEYGKWHKFNSEYVDIVEKEIASIPAKFCPEFSFESVEYDDYLTRRIESDDEKDKSYRNKDELYTETVFNEYLRDCHGYEYFDKDLRQDKGYSVEIMDLYKDGVAFSVKKGSGASKLAYVVDQCIDGIKYLRRNDGHFAQEIKTVCIWLILDRKNPIHDKNNDADINQINALILKNKLVNWKLQMRLWGYEPLIRINYKKRNDDEN